MSALYETLVLDSGGPGAGVLLPGRILRALALGAGIAAEELGALTPLGPSRVEVEVAVGRSLSIRTPRMLPLSEGGEGVVMMLRRRDDPPDDEMRRVRLAAPGTISPGELAVALAAGSGGLIGAEDLGPVWRAGGTLVIELPAHLAETLGDELDLGGVATPLTIEGAGR